MPSFYLLLGVFPNIKMSRSISIEAKLWTIIQYPLVQTIGPAGIVHKVPTQCGNYQTESAFGASSIFVTGRRETSKNCSQSADSVHQLSIELAFGRHFM